MIFSVKRLTMDITVIFCSVSTFCEASVTPRPTQPKLAPSKLIFWIRLCKQRITTMRHDVVVEIGGGPAAGTAAEYRQHTTLLRRRNSTLPPGGGQAPCLGHEVVGWTPGYSAGRGRNRARSARQGQEGLLGFGVRTAQGFKFNCTQFTVYLHWVPKIVHQTHGATLLIFNVISKLFHCWKQLNF